jgi:cysteine dioxygenase
MRGIEDLGELLGLWGAADRPLTPVAIRGGLSGLRPGREAIAEGVAFSDASYQRVRLHATPHFEVLLLCWRSGQRSPIHDHRGSTCGVVVVEGEATETIYTPSPCGCLVPRRTRSLKQGSTCVARDADIHQMGNLAPPGRDLITLHVYSPPLTAMRVYSLAETMLADHDRLASLRPRVVGRQLRADGPHPIPSNTPVRASEVSTCS